MSEDTPQARGGKARAANLTRQELSAIARRAALARHGKNLPRAVAEGALVIGDLEISCAVLDDAPNNTRVLTQEGFLTALGRSGKPKGGEGAGADGKPASSEARRVGQEGVRTCIPRM